MLQVSSGTGDLNLIFQVADVVFSLKGDQQLQGQIGDPDRHTQSAGLLPEEQADDAQPFVDGPFAEQRDLNGQGDPALEGVQQNIGGIFRGSAHDHKPGRPVHRVAQPAVKSLVHNGEEHFLPCSRQAVDLVQEKDPFVGLFYKTLLVPVGAGEGPLHIAEKLRKQQLRVVGILSAVEHDERCAAPALALAEIPGHLRSHQGLAHARLAYDQRMDPIGRIGSCGAGHLGLKFQAALVADHIGKGRRLWLSSAAGGGGSGSEIADRALAAFLQPSLQHELIEGLGDLAIPKAELLGHSIGVRPLTIVLRFI